MTPKEFIVAWDRTYQYDFWWRQKYKIPFNSEAHREASQIFIAMEYWEERMAEGDAKKILQERERLKKLREKGWNKENADKEKEFFDSLNIDDL